MENLREQPDNRQERGSTGAATLPRSFPLIRVYLLTSILLVVGAFAVLSFSTQRIQSGTAINSLRQEAEADVERVVFDVSLAITSYVGPGDDLRIALGQNESQLDRDVINALTGHPISRVDLLSPSGELAYSTDPDATLSISQSEARRVITGEVISNYHDDYSVTLFNGQPVDIATVITANPVNTEWSVDGEPVAVMVAFRDVTGAVAEVTGLIAPERIAVLGGTMVAVFVLLSYIVIRGHRFTTQAREQLTGMLETEREMSAQLDNRNSELEEANRAKSQFLTMISHELKTPLTSIIAFNRSLSKSLGNSLSERQAKQFDALSRNSKHLKMLIEELLDGSAASAGKMKLHFEEVSPEKVVQDAVQLVQAEVEGRKQQLAISMDAADVTFNGDADRLKQVVSNLLSNASKYSPAKSEIRLSVMADEEHISFNVTDRGIGISEPDQKKLFSTFFRTEQAIASGAPGTGIGLVIVRSIVDGHGGTVKIDSELGSGTTVSVELPLKKVLSEDLANESPDAA